MAIMKQTVEIDDPTAKSGRRTVVVVKPHIHVSDKDHGNHSLEPVWEARKEMIKTIQSKINERGMTAAAKRRCRLEIQQLQDENEQERSEEQEAAAAEAAARTKEAASTLSLAHRAQYNDKQWEPVFEKEWEQMQFDPSSTHIGAHNFALEEGGLQKAGFVAKEVLGSRQDKDRWNTIRDETRDRGKECLEFSHSTRDNPKGTIGMKVANEEKRDEEKRDEEKRDKEQRKKEQREEKVRAHTHPATQGEAIQPNQSLTRRSGRTADAVHAQITKVRDSRVTKPQAKNASAGDGSRSATRTYSPPAHKFGTSTVASRSRSPAKAAPTTTEQINTAAKPRAKTPMTNDDRTSDATHTRGKSPHGHNTARAASSSDSTAQATRAPITKAQDREVAKPRAKTPVAEESHTHDATHTRGQSPQRIVTARVPRSSRSTANAAPAPITGIRGDRAAVLMSTSSTAQGVPETHQHSFQISHYPETNVNDMPGPSTNRSGQLVFARSTAEAAVPSRDQSYPINRMPTLEDEASLESVVERFIAWAESSLKDTKKKLTNRKSSGDGTEARIETGPKPPEDHAEMTKSNNNNLTIELAVEELLNKNGLGRHWRKILGLITRIVNQKLLIAGQHWNQWKQQTPAEVKFDTWDKNPLLRRLMEISGLEVQDSTVKIAPVIRVQQHEAAKTTADELHHRSAELNLLIESARNSGYANIDEKRELGLILQTFAKDFIGRATKAFVAKGTNALAHGTPSQAGTDPQIQLDAASVAEIDNAIQGLEGLYKSTRNTRTWKEMQSWIDIIVTETIQARKQICWPDDRRKKEIHHLWETDVSLLVLRQIWRAKSGQGPSGR